MDLDKSLMKLGLDKQSVVRSNQDVILYPRGFIYDLNQPDSVTYFGCISTDRNSIESYFAGESTLKFSSGSIMIRQVGEHSDSIKMLALNELTNRLTKKDSSLLPIIESKTQFLIIYFWNPEIMDRHIIKNYKYFKKYSNRHPELKIQVIAVLNE
jgi:hypothetical protein